MTTSRKVIDRFYTFKEKEKITPTLLKCHQISLDTVMNYENIDTIMLIIHSLMRSLGES